QFRARPPRRRPRSRIPLHPSAEEPALRTLRLAPTLASAPDSPGWCRRKKQEGGKKKGRRRKKKKSLRRSWSRRKKRSPLLLEDWGGFLFYWLWEEDGVFCGEEPMQREV